MKISCLHTATGNIAVFDQAAASLGIPTGTLTHHVQSDLLEQAESSGGLTPDIVTQTVDSLCAVAHGADAVLLTCSTLAPAVELAAPKTSVPIVRADAALAELAVGAGGKVVVLCAVATTLDATSHLFMQAARSSGVLVEVRLVPGAWQMFKAGHVAAYLRAIARAADIAYEEGATMVALAQASMAAAAKLVTGGPEPLTSPLTGLAHAYACAQAALSDRLAKQR